MERTKKPNWWLLYLTVPLMVILLVLQGEIPSPASVHEILEIGIVLACFGLMAVWVQANQAALMNEQFEREHWRLVSDRNEMPDRDPHHLPLADVADDTDQEPFQLESSPTKGRYN